MPLLFATIILVLLGIPDMIAYSTLSPEVYAERVRQKQEAEAPLWGGLWFLVKLPFRLVKAILRAIVRFVKWALRVVFFASLATGVIVMLANIVLALTH